MSVRISARVWELRLPATEKLVLLKLADCSDDEGGNAWPSVATLGRACGNLSIRGVHKVLVKLKARGLLQVQAPAGGTHKSVTYRVTLPAPTVNARAPLNPSSPVSSRSGGDEPLDRGTPELQFTGPLNPSSPDPSLIRPSAPSTTAVAANQEQFAARIDDFKTTFSNLYHQHRCGATYHWTPRDATNAHALLAVYAFDDLVAMSDILLTLPSDVDPWVSASDRSVSVLRHRATFLHARLSARTSAPDAWTRVLARLETKLSTWEFRKWFGSTTQLKMSTDGRTMWVGVEGRLQQRWIEDHYRDQVAAAVAEAAIPGGVVIFAPTPYGRDGDTRGGDDRLL